MRSDLGMRKRTRSINIPLGSRILCKSALVPHEQFGFSPEINIYDNKVMIASWREKLGITIESKEIADALRKIFELSWAEAKRLNDRIKG